MDVYLSEEEQIKKIKEWWKKYSPSIIAGIAIFFIVSFGWRYWRNYKIQTAGRASMLYEQMLIANSKNKAEDFKLFAKRLMDNYKRSPYAILAAFTLAKRNIENKARMID